MSLISYDYNDLEQDLKNLNSSCYIIGKSVLGRNIYTFKIGHGKKNVLFVSAHHGLEWLTPPLLMRFAKDFLKAEEKGTRLKGYNISDLCEKATLHFVPMLNPDGIEIAQHGTKDEKLIKINRGNDFKQNWQSNGRGVDLNHNYDAGFDLCKKEEYKLGITCPAPTRYGGKYPESEPEVKALCNYVRENDFSGCIAFHSQGEAIYYDYNGYVPENGYEICRQMCKESGYLPDKTDGIASYGGFKDWFILKYKRPAFTVETGHGKNPLNGCQFEEIYKKNLGLILVFSFLC